MKFFFALVFALFAKATVSAIFLGGRIGGGLRPIRKGLSAGYTGPRSIRAFRPVLAKPSSFPTTVPIAAPLKIPALVLQQSVLGPRFAPGVIQKSNTIEFRQLPESINSEIAEPIVVAIDGAQPLVDMMFKSKSSALSVLQRHIASEGSHQISKSEDEPHILRHLVTKPVIQEVHEIVTPLRKVTQEILPVQEDIQTTVAKNSGGIVGTTGFGDSGSLASGSLNPSFGSSSKTINLVGISNSNGNSY